MVKYTLHYFNIKARGELSRLIAVAGGLDWEDRRIEFADWPTVKPTTPAGQVPYLTTDDGRLLTQSTAIARYLAEETGLRAKDNKLRAKEDAMIATIWDCNQFLIDIRFKAKTDEEKAELLGKFKDALERFLGKMEENYTKDDWFFEGRMGWVDLAFADMFTGWWLQAADVLAKFPKLNKRVERVSKNPNVKKWLDTRPATDL